MDIKAFKMNGLGNDFVIIDQRHNEFSLTNDQIKKICDRDFIGCDQLIIIKKSPFHYLREDFDPDTITEIYSKFDDDNYVKFLYEKVDTDSIKNINNYLNRIDASLVFYNSDGSTSGACGNGTRCVAYLLGSENGKREITFWIDGNVIPSEILDGKNYIGTTLGFAKTLWHEIPLSKELDTKNLNYKIVDKNNSEYFGGVAVNVGNPHIIFFLKHIENFDLEKIGPKIENDELFPEKCNVTFAKEIHETSFKIKVWERGAGLTKACGTAACATAVAANLENQENSSTDIEFSLGKLTINIDEHKLIHMFGPVSDIEEINFKI